MLDPMQVDLILKGVYGILLPALAAGIIWGLAWRIWNRSAAPIAGGTWAGALAVGAAMIVGYLGCMAWPGFPPKVGEGWLPFVAALAIFAGVLEHFAFRATAPRSTLWLATIGLSFWLLMTNARANAQGSEMLIWTFALIAIAWIVAMLVEPLALRWPGASIPLALWIWTAGIAGSIAMRGTITYAHLAGVLAAAMGAALVATWIKPAILFARGAATTLILLGNAFLILAQFYSDLPTFIALILAAAPLALWLGELSVIAKRKPWLAAGLRAAAIAIPVAIALVIAAWPLLTAKPSAGGEADFYK